MLDRLTLVVLAATPATILSVGTASAVLINEFEPNPFGADPSTQSIELRGSPGDSFSGNIFSIEADTPTATIDRANAISGVFDTNGLLVVSIPDLENPSFTLVLSADDATATLGMTLNDFTALGTVLDAIGIPDSALDEANLVGAALGGTDFVFTGDEPKLVFRDRFDPTLLWAVNDPPLGVVHSAEGTTAISGDFVFGNPFASTFGAVNPTTLSAPANPILINEFEPNPSGSDPASVSIELRGPPGGSFTGSLIAVEANLATPTVNRSNAISGIFDTNGLLVVTISDLENPSFTLVLLENDVPPTLGEMFDVATYLPTTLDAIGIPDSALDEANLVGAALGGTDFVFTGDEPKLVFRDALDPSIVWAVNDPPFGQLINAEGAVASDDDFVFGNPLVPTFGAVNPTSATDVLQGDFNLDGVVNAADYTVWRDGLGTKFTPSDYTLWADNYGITSGPASGTIPEPAAGILWLVALSAFWRNCRRD